MLGSTEDKKALDQCFKRSWLHATTVQEQAVYIFASPLHRWFIEYHLGTKVTEFSPMASQDLPAFAIDVIRQFSRPKLFARVQVGII
jgi:hypothetical protein